MLALRIVFCSSTFICFLEFLNHFTYESHSIRSSCLYPDGWPLIPWDSLLSVLSAGVTSVYNCAWPFTWVLGFELFSLTCHRQSCLVSHFSMPWTPFHVQYLFNPGNEPVMLGEEIRIQLGNCKPSLVPSASSVFNPISLHLPAAAWIRAGHGL